VQYRKVTSRWFSSEKVDKMKLSTKSWWEKYNGPRDLQGEPNDMLEVELEDETTLPVDRDYDECTMESGEIFVSIL
jgi:hypothetical protein